MTTLAKHIIVAGAKNCPPMLEKSMYDSWASHIRLFIKGKKHGRMMLDFIDNGLLVYPTVEENRHTRPMKYSELTEAQQLQDDCDVQATNIILQGLPPDVYALVNHQEILLADQWHAYYWDDNATSLSQYQVSECSSIGMGYSDPLALVANSPTLYNSSQSPQHLGSLTYPPPQQFTPVYAAPIHHQHHHTSVNPQQHPVSHPSFISPLVTQQSQAEFPQLDFSLIVPMFQQREVPIECINKAMAFLSAIASSVITVKEKGIWRDSVLSQKHQEAGQILDEEQLAFLADPGISEAPIAYCDLEVLSEVPYSDSYPNDMINQDVEKLIDSQMDDLIRDRNAKLAAFQQEIDTLKETLSNNGKEKESLSKTLTVLKTESKEKESKYIDKEIVLEKQNKELENIISQRIQPILYDGIVIAKEHAVNSMIDDEEILILEEESRSKMLDKQNDPISIEKKINISPIDYSKLNKIKIDFGKHFVIQKELSAEQDFWLKHSIQSLSGKDSVKNLKKYIDEIETINIKLEHRMFKLDIEPISARLKNNRDAHEVYIEKTIEYADTFRRFVERARTQYPSEPLFESTCMFTKHVQELLVYTSQTCPNSPKPSEKLVVVTPRVKPTTSANGSKPSGNINNNRITRPPRNNQNNKVEDNFRKVESSLNKTDTISEPISNALVKHSVRNAKFESMYAICNKRLFDANHDMCLIDFVNDVNVRSKSKSKRKKMRKAWKPTGKVFTDIGYKWKPTRRLFTIVGSSCPLTRITPKKIMHLKKSTPKSAETPKPDIKVYSRRPKQLKSVGSSKKVKIVESKIANNSEPTHL
ncbi:hypothetical protein Tco_1329390 [Tanacetum coccineum]